MYLGEIIFIVCMLSPLVFIIYAGVDNYLCWKEEQEEMSLSFAEKLERTLKGGKKSSNRPDFEEVVLVVLAVDVVLLILTCVIGWIKLW